jgi:hypothetical protein
LQGRPGFTAWYSHFLLLYMLIVVPNEPLIRPYDNFNVIGDVGDNLIAWPSSCVCSITLHFKHTLFLLTIALYYSIQILCAACPCLRMAIGLDSYLDIANTALSLNFII